jgi:hypothetical protein
MKMTQKRARPGRASLVAAVLLPATAALLVAGCNTPSVVALSPSSGPAGQVVTIEATDAFITSVVWNAGRPDERTIPGGFLGATMFSVPAGAATGAHPVAIQRAVRDAAGAVHVDRSNLVTFTVTAPRAPVRPRLERVSIMNATFSGPNVIPMLYVQGANLDVGATILIDGAAVPSSAHRVMDHQSFGLDPRAQAFPIYHHLAVAAMAGRRARAITLTITARNLDGAVSDPFTYRLPDAPAHLDSDGDGITDDDERLGVDTNGDGVRDLDLSQVGADPHRPNIFLEVDVMPAVNPPPGPGVWEGARQLFARAPILNPRTDVTGIALTIDATGSVPNIPLITVDPSPGATQVSTLKNMHMTPGRRGLYHYGVWGLAMPGGFSGFSDADLLRDRPGDDLIVTFNNFPASFHVGDKFGIATLVHELGHNLGLRHGGGNHSALKANYPSVMSYTWQARPGESDLWRAAHPTCTPLFYGIPGAVEPGGLPPAGGRTVLDFSHGTLATLIENNNSLQEAQGVCGLPIDWNRDGVTTGFNVSADTDGEATTVAGDFADWAALDYRGPRPGFGGLY